MPLLLHRPAAPPCCSTSLPLPAYTGLPLDSAPRPALPYPALQFLSKRQAAVRQADLAGLRVGQKDMTKGAFQVWAELLQKRVRPSGWVCVHKAAGLSVASKSWGNAMQRETVVSCHAPGMF